MPEQSSVHCTCWGVISHNRSSERKFDGAGLGEGTHVPLRVDSSNCEVVRAALTELGQRHRHWHRERFYSPNLQ